MDVFKGAGNNPIDGKKKGGLKVHAKLPLISFVPDLISLTDAATNDKLYLGRLTPEKGDIYINYISIRVFTYNSIQIFPDYSFHQAMEPVCLFPYMWAFEHQLTLDSLPAAWPIQFLPLRPALPG